MKLWLMATAGVAGVVLLAVAAVCATSGCSSLGYYVQSVGGHLQMVRSAKPVPDWLADEQTPATLRQRLVLSQRMRDFAVRELALPDNASYRRYADLRRPYAVWNVVAAPELDLTLKTWCFPVVGCVGYRGYFDRSGAEAYAAELRVTEPGLEVSVYGVPAYSTLGKLPLDMLADPLLSTFIQYPEGELARLIFHELAHQVAFAADDTVFNESFATAVERIGSRRWLETQADAAAREAYRVFDGRRNDFRILTQRTRDRLDAIYRGPLADAEKRNAKSAALTELHSDYERLKAERWGGFSGYDGWFARANNASFGVLAAYTEAVPAFERLFERQGGDFPRFYAEVRRLAAMPKGERLAALKSTGD